MQRISIALNGNGNGDYSSHQCLIIHDSFIVSFLVHLFLKSFLRCTVLGSFPDWLLDLAVAVIGLYF